MKVIVEKRKVVGTLKTLLGTYSLLSLDPRPDFVLRISDALWFDVVDDESFAGSLLIRGDFIIIPSSVHTAMDVRRVVLTEEEAQKVEILNTVTID